jgi:hypothetical protein
MGLATAYEILEASSAPDMSYKITQKPTCNSTPAGFNPTLPFTSPRPI